MASWNYQSTGASSVSTTGTALTPGAPSGLTSGELELLFTAQRTAGAAGPGSITGWTRLVTTGYAAATAAADIWGRFATGGADDTPTVDWDGTNFCCAWIERYNGGGYTDLATIVAHSAANIGTATTLNLPAVAGVTVDNCTVVGYSAKNNTAINATAISHSSLTVRTQLISVAASRMHAASGTLQQTTAADYDGTDFTIDGTSESLGSRGLVMFLRTADGGVGHSYRQGGGFLNMNGNLRG